MMRMARGYDPAAFDIVREEYRDRDERDFRDREFERERERPERIEERDIPDRMPPMPAALEEVVNNDSIVLTPEMVEVINDPMMRVSRRGEISRLNGRRMISRSGQFSRSALLPRLNEASTKTRRKRKPSKYQKELGKQLKILKKKHPRTPVIRLMKRAHRATKKALK